MTFHDRASARFLRLPRRMAGAAALCVAAAACSGLSPQPTRLDAARRPVAMADAGCALLAPHAVTAALKQQQQPPRVDSWRLARSRLQQEYDLEGVIGEGGFGLVHVARHRASNARVAVKRVPKQLTSKERFLQEVAILRQLGGTHNVLQLRDAFETSDAYVLVTELVRGGELYDDLVAHGVFGEPRARALVRELAVALQYLHSASVVHADLKPENILLCDDEMRLIDFGQSFRLHEARGRRVDACTTAYASPELLEQRASGCAVDVWALGVVLYIVLCGAHPFDPTDDASDEQLQQRIVKGDFDRDAPGWACMSDGARDLVRRMLTVDPEQRISAAQVLEHEWVTGA
ncbi:CAMK protein kinase [Phytophthora cinnamomi]|uniref:CAMK protein kinase n=1 Tax=Phytophthora cinnamomi TaxID=4785 RepID=UPI00355A4AF1|nr:CAMK protein kinase [Phytophthora cinnamomi]